MRQPLSQPFCTDLDAPMSAAEAAQYTVGTAPYMHGIPGSARRQLPGYDSVILTLFLATIVMVCVSGRHTRTLLGRLWREMVGVRRRANAFDDNTVGDSGATFALVLLTCVCEGSLAFSWMHNAGVAMPPSSLTPFAMMPLAAGVALLYFVCQHTAYDVFGFTFTDKIGRVQWVRGYNASQALLALGLIAPALVSLFYPSMTVAMCLTGVTMYVLFRILFIIKGLRIFCKDFSSFFYFILYLCTLEIAPIALLVRIGQF